MTPQTELTLNNLFDGKEIRVLDHDHDIWIPISDIASAWGIDRSTPDKIIERNDEVFFGLSNTVLDAMSTPMKCLNERGLYLLMGKISAAHLKNQEAKKTIIRFQRWFPELVQKYRKKEIVQTTLVLQTPIEQINERLDMADIAVKRSGVPKEIAHAMAWATGDSKEISLSIAGYIKAQTVQQQLQLPAASREDIINYDKHFSITKVAAALKLPIDKVRNVLESLNIIYFENGFWKLTKHGEQYGKMFMVTPGYPYRTNQKCYIKYNPLLIDLLKKYFDIEMPATKVPE